MAKSMMIGLLLLPNWEIHAGHVLRLPVSGAIRDISTPQPHLLTLTLYSALHRFTAEIFASSYIKWRIKFKPVDGPSSGVPWRLHT